jgi:hypothetical protein
MVGKRTSGSLVDQRYQGERTFQQAQGVRLALFIILGSALASAQTRQAVHVSRGKPRFLIGPNAFSKK